MSQNLLEKCFERLGEMILRSEDVPSVSSETKNINKVGLDMSSHLGKSQTTTIANKIRTGDISLSKDKNISKGTQDKSLKDNSFPKDKHLLSGDNSPSNDKFLPKEENSDYILFFPKEKTENTTINASFILSDIETKYLTFSEFIYNNPNGPGYCQTSTESIYPIFVQKDR